MKKYSRVTYRQRCQIEILMQGELSKADIATRLGLHKSTICREIARNSSYGTRHYEKRYEPLRAQGLYRERKERCRRKLKISDEIQRLIIKLLKFRWSPELIAGRLRRKKRCQITCQTIYRFIRNNPIYAKYLRYYGRKRFEYRRSSSKPKPGWWVSIEERPKSCRERERVGDWERDTMMGKDRKQALLVCTDRKSRFTKIAVLDELNSDTVAKKTIELTKEAGRELKTITNDNGVEFKAPNKLPVQVYYCHPYSPQERGTVENIIGIIRRFCPKKTDLSKLNVSALENWINHRPMKVLDYRTPYEVYYGTSVALAI